MTYSAIQSSPRCRIPFFWTVFASRKQDTQFFFFFLTFLGLSFLLPTRLMLISWSVFISRALFPVYRSLKSRPLNYNQIPRHNAEVLTLRIIPLYCLLVTVRIFLVKSSCQTTISDLELRFQDLNKVKIKSTTEIGQRCVLEGKLLRFCVWHGWMLTIFVSFMSFHSLSVTVCA